MKDILPKNKADADAKNTNGKMIQCAKCGTHVPESETILKQNKVFCNNPDCIVDHQKD
jgi:ribosomal protein S26